VLLREPALTGVKKSADAIELSVQPETPDGTTQFSIWKRAIFRKVKEIKDLSGGVVLYAAQSNPPIDAEIAEKGRFRTKTSYN
jgi:hypothetical protein